jgi:hypothetical protein
MLMAIRTGAKPMNTLHKLSTSCLLGASLLWMPAALAQDVPFQLAQEIRQETSLDNVGDSQKEAAQGDNPTMQQNTTMGGDTRNFTAINEGAREENEGSPGKPGFDSGVSNNDVDWVDNNDPEEGFDGTFVGIMLLVGLGLAVMLLVANRRDRPTDSYHS